MIAAQGIEIQRVERSRAAEFDFSDIPFGKHYTDHMFMADYLGGAWKNLRIVPYGKITISPASPTLHYAHSIFEGLKAYRSEAGEALVFRPLENLKRLNRSAERMCLATVPESLYMVGMRDLLGLDHEWIPRQAGASLYTRPFLFS